MTLFKCLRNPISVVYVGASHLADPSSQDERRAEPIEQAQVDAVQSEHDIFRIVLGFAANMSDRRESMGSFLDSLRMFRTTVTDTTLQQLVPVTWKQTVKFLNNFSSFKMVEPVVYDVCKNDCVLFRSMYATHTVCPMCDAERYVDKKPVRKFSYLSVVQRVRRWLSSPAWSNELANVERVSPSGPREVNDVYDGTVWNSIFGADGDRILKSKYNIAFGLGVDGVCARDSDDYSITPLLLTCFSFSKYKRNKRDFCICAGFIPGKYYIARTVLC